MIHRKTYTNVKQVVVTPSKPGIKLRYVDVIDIRNGQITETMLPFNIEIAPDFSSITIDFSYSATGIVLYYEDEQ